MKVIIETIPHASHRYPTCGDWYERRIAKCPGCEFEGEEPQGQAITQCPLCHAQITAVNIQTVLFIKVSEELERENRLFAVLVAFHEWAEVEQCKVAGITEAEVDAFDKQFEHDRELGLRGETDEPGDDSQAPYRVQHGVATGIERLLAAVMGVDWNKYDAAINALP